ncbi:MAG: histidine kinase dimerization/phospho-acceptor domain-containing protein, partial [Chitinophagaceae bacterium]
MKQLLLILFLSCACRLQAQDSLVYNFDSTRQVHELRAYTYLLAIHPATDSTSPFDDETVLSGKVDKDFSRLNQIRHKTSYDSYWLHFKILAKAPVDKWILLLRENEKGKGYTSQNDYVDVWYVKQGKISGKERTGTMVPRSQKNIHPHAGFNGVQFSIKANEQTDVYIKVAKKFYENTGYSYPAIVDPVIPTLQEDTADDFFPVLNAIALIFCAISLFFYIFIKERSYLFFALYTFVLSQHYLILHPDIPFIDKYIPEHPQWVAGFWELLTIGSFVLFCIFGKWFMNLASLSPKTDKWFRIFLWIWSGVIVINAISVMTRLESLIPQFVSYAGMGIMLGFIIRFAFFRSILAKLYVVGAAWLFVFTVLGLLWGNGIVQLPFNPWPVAQVGQLLIFAAALAYKVRLNELARAKANRIQEMDAIKSKFFANISHEFRTPLTLIQGPLQQIEERVTDAAKQNGTIAVPWRQLKTMRRNTDRFLELVNQLLDLSKLDAGNM